MDRQAPRYIRNAILSEIRLLNMENSEWYGRAGIQIEVTDLPHQYTARSDLLLLRRRIMNINSGAYAAGI